MTKDTPSLRDAYFSLEITCDDEIDDLRLHMNREARDMAEQQGWEVLGHLELQLPILASSKVKPRLLRTYIFRPL